MFTEIREDIHHGLPLSQTIATDLEAGVPLSYRPYSSLNIHPIARQDSGI